MLFELAAIDVEYTLKRNNFLALNNLWLTGQTGKTVGIVGESGCGKSTLGKVLLGLQKPKSGTVLFNSHNMFDLSKKELKQVRKEIQPVFQDPDAALNPRMTIEQQLQEGLRAHNLMPPSVFSQHVATLLEMVQLPSEVAKRYPFQLSGGQKQRICIARALSVKPQLIVCDEPLSSLDMPIRLQIVELLLNLQAQERVAYLFITHDLTTLKWLAHSIAVLYLGAVVEWSDAASLYTDPLHPYTQALLSAQPIPDPIQERSKKRIILHGDVPSPLNPPSGCPFHTRCPEKMARCEHEKPLLKEIGKRRVACHLYA